MNYIIVNSKVKELALHAAKEYRPAWQAKRVSKKFLDRINARTRAIITEEVKHHPSVGQTIY